MIHSREKLDGSLRLKARGSLDKDGSMIKFFLQASLKKKREGGR
jgi:hypothetical protein